MVTLSLNSKLHILIGFLVTSVTAIAVVLTLQYVQQDKLKELELRAHRTADLQAHALIQPLWELDKTAEYYLLDALTKDDALLYATVETGDTTQSMAIGNKPENSEDVITVNREIIHQQGEQRTFLGTLSLVFSKDSLQESRTTLILSGVLATIIFLITTLGGIFIALKFFTRPLNEITRSVLRLAEGDHSVTVPSLDRNDEIGKIAKAVQIFKNNALDNINLQREAQGERSLKEEETRRALIAHQANQEKSRFLSNMSHELRTPLNAILGFSQLLESSKKDQLSDRQRKHLAQITKGGHHLLNLINDILDLSKVEAGKMVMSIETVDSRSLLNDCLAFSIPMAKKKNITLQDRTGPDLPALWADHLRAKQVILNLMSNAIKYNHDHSLVWLEAKLIKKNMLRISVGDTGFGIPQAKQDSLFQPFQRLGAEATEIEGSGIGLVLTKKMIEEMGGSIGYKSVEKKGSCFWVDFPLAHTGEKDDKLTDNDGQIPSNSLMEKSQLLLYVEDNPSNLALMEGIVDEIPNLALVSADTAERGLVLAEELKPDVIILDINLPGMSGYEAVKLLKKTAATKEMPVIALTANAMPHDLRKGKDSDFSHYLTKPIDLSTLLNTLHLTLNSPFQMETP